MTTTLSTFTVAYDRNFIMLLEDWGRWERTSALSAGWGNSRRDPPRFIDDATALILNAAYGRYCQQRVKQAQLIELKYIRGLDCVEIRSYLARTLNHKYLLISTVEQCLEHSTKLFYNLIRSQYARV